MENKCTLQQLNILKIVKHSFLGNESNLSILMSKQVLSWLPENPTDTQITKAYIKAFPYMYVGFAVPYPANAFKLQKLLDTAISGRTSYELWDEFMTEVEKVITNNSLTFIELKAESKSNMRKILKIWRKLYPQ